MIPVIYKGDDTDFLGAEGFSVRIELADGLDLTGCTVEVSILGTTHKYPISGTGALVCPFVFSAKETAAMPLGVHCAKVRIIDTAGRVRTIMDAVRVKVVDTVAEAYGEGSEHELKIELSKGAALPAIPEELRATDSDSLGTVKEKMNQVVDLLRSASACVAFLFALPLAASVAPRLAPINDIHGTAPVVLTNSVEYIAGQIAAATNPIPATVTNVVRDTVGTVWDGSLGVAWQARMHNGHLYYIAVTNQPPEAK